MATDATASGFTPPGDSPIDTQTGAPLKVRLAVASVSDPVDRLRELRKYYPDAHPDKYGGYVYTDLKTGRPTRFDETQFTLRDILESIPGVAELGGAMAGGVAGGAAGLPTFGVGAIPGAILGAGAGAVGAREVASRTLQAITGAKDTRPMAEQGTDAAATFGANALGQAVGMAIPAAAKGAGKMLGKATRMTPDAAELAVQAAGERQGIVVPKVLNTRSRILQWTDKVLRQNPLTTQTMTDAGDKFTDQLGNLAGRIEGDLAGGQQTGPAIFNQTLRDASQGWIDRFKATRNALDDAILQYIPPETRVPVPNTVAALDELSKEVERSPNLNWDKLKLAIAQMRKVVADAAGETQSVPTSGVAGAVDAMGNPILSGTQQQVVREAGVPFDVLRETRTAVGDAANWESPLVRKTPEERALGLAYDALKKDIGHAAEQAGPDALDALHLHDAYVQMSRDQKQFVNFDTFKKMAEGSPDRDVSPINWVMANSKGGGKKVASALNQMLPQERRAIAGSVFQALGETEKDGMPVWDMAKFASNWRKLGPVRNEVFGIPELRHALPAIQDLAQLTETGLKAKALSGYKPSALGIGLTVGAGWLGRSNPVALGLGATGSMAVAQMLTNPEVARLIGTGLKGTANMAGFGARLLAVKKTQPLLADAIDEFVHNAHGAGMPMPDPETAKRMNTGRPNLQYEPIN